ncbi:LOB domain-containing protein 38-like [Salvia hispanica]|uniref:LOB domain-containing protein 38-like n=1 Tax=Salvia hispanica TaxID=49212 RepID=UPI002009CB25|nr:LOB domain-containing protein 38-like [Salvia hispanica]
MSCSGCRILRRGCSNHCILRPCLDWIPSPEAQAHATLFVSKFFGRSYLLTFIASVPVSKRSALFQSLLYDACGRTVNPVNGVVGLLTTGNWHICQAAVEAVLAGEDLTPIGFGNPPPAWRSGAVQDCSSRVGWAPDRAGTMASEAESGVDQVGAEEMPKLLNLFA